MLENLNERGVILNKRAIKLYEPSSPSLWRRKYYFGLLSTTIGKALRAIYCFTVTVSAHSDYCTPTAQAHSKTLTTETEY